MAGPCLGRQYFLPVIGVDDLLFPRPLAVVCFSNGYLRCICWSLEHFNSISSDSFPHHRRPLTQGVDAEHGIVCLHHEGA